jgi:hypothetical protein
MMKSALDMFLRRFITVVRLAESMRGDQGRRRRWCCAAEAPCGGCC